MGISERIENGLQPFDAARTASQILDMGDIVGLVETVERNVDADSAKKMTQKMNRGIFTFDDFNQQIGQMQKWAAYMHWSAKCQALNKCHNN